MSVTVAAFRPKMDAQATPGCTFAALCPRQEQNNQGDNHNVTYVKARVATYRHGSRCRASSNLIQLIAACHYRPMIIYTSRDHWLQLYLRGWRPQENLI
jgi:hypothetical protein